MADGTPKESPRAHPKPVCLGCEVKAAVSNHTLCQDCLFEHSPKHFEPLKHTTTCAKCMDLPRSTFHDLKLAVDYRIAEGHFAPKRVVREWLKKQRGEGTPITSPASKQSTPASQRGKATPQLPGAAAAKAAKEAFLRSPLGGSLQPGGIPPPKFAAPAAHSSKAVPVPQKHPLTSGDTNSGAAALTDRHPDHPLTPRGGPRTQPISVERGGAQVSRPKQ